MAGGSTVAEVAVALDSLLWAHQHSDAAVSSAGLVAFEDQDRIDLSAVAIVAVLEAHSRNLEADRHGRSIDSSLSTKKGVSADPKTRRVDCWVTSDSSEDR